MGQIDWIGNFHNSEKWWISPTKVTEQGDNGNLTKNVKQVENSITLFVKMVDCEIAALHDHDKPKILLASHVGAPSVLSHVLATLFFWECSDDQPQSSVAEDTKWRTLA